MNEDEDGADENGEAKDEEEGADGVKEEAVEEDESEDVIKKYGLDTYDDEGKGTLHKWRHAKLARMANGVLTFVSITTFVSHVCILSRIKKFELFVSWCYSLYLCTNSNIQQYVILDIICWIHT